MLRLMGFERYFASFVSMRRYLCTIKNRTNMDITPQMLIEQTQNFYGLKAELATAIEFIERGLGSTPGSFYEWMIRQ